MTHREKWEKCDCNEVHEPPDRTTRDTDTILPKVSWATPTKQTETGVRIMLTVLVVLWRVSIPPIQSSSAKITAENSSWKRRSGQWPTFIFWNVQNLVDCLWKTHAMLLCGDLWEQKEVRVKATSLRGGVTVWTDVSLTAETDSSVTSFSTSMTEM